MAKGMDSPFSLVDEIDQMISDGITYVARYYDDHGFKTPLGLAEALAYSRRGIRIVSIVENGEPTSIGYFTPARGTYDANLQRKYGTAAHQPAGTDSYFTVDYDAGVQDLPAIGEYFIAIRAALRQPDGTLLYYPAVYGNGLVCRYLIEQGLVHRTWLAAGRRMQGHDDWLPHANIVQTDVDQRYHGIDVDDDLTDGNGGGWLPTT